MQDHLTKATVAGVRGFAAVTTNLVDEARRRHDCFPVAAAALGRTMTAALLLAANLKNDESITIRVAGDGPLGSIIADARANGNVRGFVKNPQADVPLRDNKLDVGKAVGSGHIYVTRFTGLGQPFTGSVPLVSGEIAEDITNYLMISEQTSSSVALGVLVEPDTTVTAAGGFFLQVMPEAEDEVLRHIERNLDTVPPVSQMVSEGRTAAEMLTSVFAGLQTNIYGEESVIFHCSCSRQRAENILRNLGRQELMEMKHEGKAELICHFCAKQYQFGPNELEKLMDSLMDEKK